MEQKAAVAAQIKDYLANDETGKAALAQSTTEFITNVEGLMAQNGVTMDAQTTAVLEAVIKGVFEQAFTNIYISAYESGMEKGMGEVLSEVSAQLDNYSPMITQLQSAAGTLASGSAVVADGVNQLYEGTKQLDTGLDTMYDSAKSLPERCECTLFRKRDSSIPGIGQLKDGGTSLDSGLGQLKDGASTLKAGTSTLKSGAHKLVEGCVTLDSATNRILNGFVTLKTGVSTFRRRSIRLRCRS